MLLAVRVQQVRKKNPYFALVGIVSTSLYSAQVRVGVCGQGPKPVGIMIRGFCEDEMALQQNAQVKWM